MNLYCTPSINAECAPREAPGGVGHYRTRKGGRTTRRPSYGVFAQDNNAERRIVYVVRGRQTNAYEGFCQVGVVASK